MWIRTSALPFKLCALGGVKKASLSIRFRSHSIAHSNLKNVGGGED